MEYILSAVFGQTLQRSGPVTALLALAAFAAVVIAAYAAKAKVDGWRTEATNARSDAASAASERARETAAREQERQALINEIRAAREQTFKLMENHLAHDRQEREDLSKVLSSIHEENRAHVETLRSLQITLEANRTASSEGRTKIHERLNDLAVQLAGKKAL
ncbi:MAG: hypothetical protein V4510_09990 [bacterium]